MDKGRIKSIGATIIPKDKGLVLRAVAQPYDIVYQFAGEKYYIPKASELVMM